MLAVAELAGTDGMGSAVLGMIVDVVAGSGLEPKVSMSVRFLDLPNFLRRRFISLNSGLWCSSGRDERQEERRFAII